MSMAKRRRRKASGLLPSAAAGRTPVRSGTTARPPVGGTTTMAKHRRLPASGLPWGAWTWGLTGRGGDIKPAYVEISPQDGLVRETATGHLDIPYSSGLAIQPRDARSTPQPLQHFEID